MPTLSNDISSQDIEQLIELARNQPELDNHRMSESDQHEYYRFSSGLVDFHGTNKALTEIMIREMYGDNTDVIVLRLGIIAVPRNGRSNAEIIDDFIDRLDHVDTHAIARQVNIVSDVKTPVYKQNREMMAKASKRLKFNPFKSGEPESRITPEEREILEDIAKIIAQDEEYTEEEKHIMETIQRIMIEDDITFAQVNDESSEIGKLVAELRMMNRPGVETKDETGE